MFDEWDFYLIDPQLQVKLQVCLNPELQAQQIFVDDHKVTVYDEHSHGILRAHVLLLGQ